MCHRQFAAVGEDKWKDKILFVTWWKDGVEMVSCFFVWSRLRDFFGNYSGRVLRGQKLSCINLAKRSKHWLILTNFISVAQILDKAQSRSKTWREMNTSNHLSAIFFTGISQTFKTEKKESKDGKTYCLSNSGQNWFHFISLDISERTYKNKIMWNLHERFVVNKIPTRQNYSLNILFP